MIDMQKLKITKKVTKRLILNNFEMVIIALS